MDTVRAFLGTVSGGLFVVAMWTLGASLAAPGSSSAAPALGSAQQRFTNPHGDIDTACADCHSAASWTELRDPLVFDHAEATGFDLEAGHGVASCSACHESLVFEYVPSACADCHTEPHRGELGFGCETCHTSAGWQDRQQIFIYHFTTLFPLQGAHATVDCDSCHTSPPPTEFATTPTECESCHEADYAATTSPNHAVNGFPSDCAACHTDTGWQSNVAFDHRAFPLSGAHVAADCASCHLDGFAGTPSECYDCHAAEYDGTTDPNHAQAGLPTACEACHSTSDWGGAVLDHDAFFPLLGSHRQLDCEGCHVNEAFAGTPTDCYSCHVADYDDTKDPNHARAGFPTDCEACHTERRWEGATFEHDQFFQLQGAHKQLECETCHVDGAYAGTPTDCYSCHKPEYDTAKDPNHRRAGFPTDCETCHTERRWEGARFEHDQFFELRGAHRRLDCETCHVDGVYAGTPTDCYSCHKPEYDSTRDPNHDRAGFPRDCETCHTEREWEGATFDHDQFFQLQGAHRQLDCATCHAGGTYAGTPTDCYACHKPEYDGTKDPNHERAGFPTDCETCHTEQRWEGATFNHDQFFQLQGAHRQLDCETCHVGGTYAGTPTDCYSCHRSDYNNTNNPNHGQAGFPTNCEGCHTEQRWEDATFNHDGFFFPIYSGEHRNEWNDCADCHPNSNNFAQFECINCHEHNQSEMADEHRGINGYQWVSTACFQCHPRGDDRFGVAGLIWSLQERFPELRPPDDWRSVPEDPR